MDNVDGSGRHPEVYNSPPHSPHQSPPQSPPQRQASPWGDMSIAGSSPPMAYESLDQNHPQEKKSAFTEHHTSPTDYSAPEVVQAYNYPHHSQYGNQYGGNPMSPHSPGMGYGSPSVPPYSPHPNEKGAEGVPPPVASEEPRRCGMKKRHFLIMLIAIVILVVVLAIALGVGLGVGLKKKDSDNGNGSTSDPYCQAHPELCIGGLLDSQYYSTKGAFNGSGIALAGESWNKNQRRIFTLFYQHWTGDLRFMQYTTDRKWIGGTKAQTVATDAKNGTAISTVAYALNATQYVHLFYISKDNKIRQQSKTNQTDIWEAGPLNDMNLAVYDSPSVGLQACWKGNYYGDSDYSKFPTASGEANQIPFDERLGINLWYASSESRFEQYAWYNGQDTWVQLDPWLGKNGHAGVGCYSWGEGTTTYTMMVNQNNDTEFWWKDTNTTTTSEEDHPINSWVNSTKGLIPKVYPATSLGYTTYFYAQMADRSLKGYNITYQAENTTVVPEDTFTITDPAGPVLGLGGTHLSATAYAEKDGNETLWDSLYVFYQTEGDDLTAFTRPIAGGEWTKGTIQLPED